MREAGIEIRLDAHATAVRREDDERVVVLEDGQELRAEELVVSVGRRPRAQGLGLETLGVEPSEGGIPIDERCRVTDGVWAAGDCTGVMLFTHVAKYQARVAMADMRGEAVGADYRAIPRVIFTDPEVAAVGLTATQAREQGVDAVSASVRLPDTIARPSTYEQDPRGELGVILDRRRRVMVGAWAVSPLASEWIHQAVLAIRAEVPYEVLIDTVAQFPSYSEAFLSALQAVELN
jgi:dihydrolipoamide dehydrogenase